MVVKLTDGCFPGGCAANRGRLALRGRRIFEGWVFAGDNSTFNVIITNHYDKTFEGHDA